MSWRHALMLVLVTLGSGACIIIDDSDDGGDDAEAPMEDTAGDDGTGPGACFDGLSCDPLSSECGDTERCVPQNGIFECVPTMLDTDEAPAGEACSGDLSCQEGLLCVAGAGCVDGFGCCTPLCDVAQPQCPGDTVCMPYFSSPSPPCYEDVGVCL